MSLGWVMAPRPELCQRGGTACGQKAVPVWARGWCILRHLPGVCVSGVETRDAARCCPPRTSSPGQARLLMGGAQHPSPAAPLTPLLLLLPRQASAPTGSPGGAGRPRGWRLPLLAAPNG